MSLVNIIKKYDIEALIMDFDNTITTKNSSTSFGVFNNQFDSEYREIKRELDRKTVNNYDELELLDIWNTKLKLLEKYYDNKILKEVRDEFVIRKDFFELYDYLNENSIKLIICSSGFRPLIKYILNENNIYNYELYANDFSTNSEDVITPMNKNKFLKIELDRVNGLDLDAVVEATNIINPILDEKDLIEENYILDVCSNGGYYE